MIEIKFAFHRNWKEAEQIARRVAMVIIGHNQEGFPLFEPEHDKRWRIDRGNDWFLRLDMDNHTATLNYRYGGGENAEFMTALAIVLNWTFR